MAITDQELIDNVRGNIDGPRWQAVFMHRDGAKRETYVEHTVTGRNEAEARLVAREYGTRIMSPKNQLIAIMRCDDDD